MQPTPNPFDAIRQHERISPVKRAVSMHLVLSGGILEYIGCINDSTQYKAAGAGVLFFAAKAYKDSVFHDFQAQRLSDGLLREITEQPQE